MINFFKEMFNFLWIVTMGIWHGIIQPYPKTTTIVIFLYAAYNYIVRRSEKKKVERVNKIKGWEVNDELLLTDRFYNLHCRALGYESYFSKYGGDSKEIEYIDVEITSGHAIGKELSLSVDDIEKNITFELREGRNKKLNEILNGE